MERQLVGVLNLNDNPAVVLGCEIGDCGELHAEHVAEGHLADSLDNATETEGIGALDLSGLYGFAQGGILTEGIFVVGHAELLLLDVEQHKLVAGLLQFGGDDMLQVADAHGEGA